MKHYYPQLLLWAALASLASLASAPVLAQSSDSSASTDATYVAHLTGMNDNVTGQTAKGEAQLEVDGDNLIITIMVRDVPGQVTHWQHIHGFVDGEAATCATKADDRNGDGIVDLIETETASGTTMVPFDTAPAAMDVAHGTYPTASTTGSYSYRQVVSLAKLQAAFGKAFKGQKLQLDKRVIYIHGVPAATDLLSSVASLGPIPASVTLPIACGKIERAK